MASLHLESPDDIPVHEVVFPGPADCFDGRFTDAAAWSCEPGGLLDTDAARRWFALIQRTVANNEYIFQQPLEGRVGPHVSVNGRRMLMLSAYDYLGLVGHAEIERAAIHAIRRFGTGTGGVRLLTGTKTIHRELEADLARFKGTDDALTFSSGYMAAVAAISALVGPADRVLVDAHAHRSIIDACRVARVPMRRFAHNDACALEGQLAAVAPGRRALVIIEGLYSMDGDIARLPEILEVARSHRAFLMVDEAHSFGVLGATGHGVDEHFGIPARAVDVWMGSLSKAIPASGGFLAGARDLMIYLQHAAAPFMFSQALCSSAVASARTALQVLGMEPRRLENMRARAEQLRTGLRGLGFDTGDSESCIVPVYIGEDDAAFALSAKLFARNVLATAVVHPSVPRGSARLRLCATAAHQSDDIRTALAAFAQCAPYAQVGAAE